MKEKNETTHKNTTHMHKQQYRITNDHQIIEMLYGDVEKISESLDSELKNNKRIYLYIWLNVYIYIYISVFVK